MVRPVVANREDVERYARAWASKDLDAIVALHAETVTTATAFVDFLNILKETLPYVELESTVLDAAFAGLTGFSLISNRVTCVKDGMTKPWVLAKQQDIKILAKGDVVEYDEICFFKCDPTTGLISSHKSGTTRA